MECWKVENCNGYNFKLEQLQRMSQIFLRRSNKTNERDNMHEHIRLYSLDKPIKGHQEQFI
jgi:hypothetical protein